MYDIENLTGQKSAMISQAFGTINILKTEQVSRYKVFCYDVKEFIGNFFKVCLLRLKKKSIDIDRFIHVKGVVSKAGVLFYFSVLPLHSVIRGAVLLDFFSRCICFQDGDDYSCQAGLSCVQTKLFIMKGQKAYVKQCVPEGMKIDVETVNKDHDQTSRNSRLLPGLPQLPRQVRN